MSLVMACGLAFEGTHVSLVQLLGTHWEETYKRKEEEFYMLRPVNKTDHMQQGTSVLA